MNIETTLGWLKPRLDKTVEYYRIKMTYGSKVEYYGTWPFTKSKQSPIEDHFEYWKLMSACYPWKGLFGVSVCARDLPPETKVYITIEAMGRILSAIGEDK